MEKPKKKLLVLVREGIWRKHYSKRSEEAYIHWIEHYIFFFTTWKKGDVPLLSLPRNQSNTISTTRGALTPCSAACVPRRSEAEGYTRKFSTSSFLHLRGYVHLECRGGQLS